MRSNRKINLIITLSLILLMLSIPVSLICFAFCLPPQYDGSFYGGMKIKIERLRAVEEKKIVIIGGSSVAFGVRSDLLEEQLDMPIVNFGLYANLGTKYMLDLAKKNIREGDVVVIAPEQDSQALSLYFNGEAAWYSADGCFDVLKRIPRENTKDMVFNFFKFVSGKFGYWRSANKPDPDNVYNAKSFNEYGDIAYERKYNVMNGGFDAGTPISFDTDIVSADFIDYVNGYCDDLVKKGAQVLFSFCPMNGAAVEAGTTDDAKKSYYDHLADKLYCPILGNPDTHILDEEWFYDSNFHLNDSGAIYYTALLAQELKSELGDYTPVTITIPNKPVPDDDEGVQGVISEDLVEASKVFDLGGVDVESEGGQVILRGNWKICGLTDHGKTLSKVVIPDMLAGIPVVEIADNAFCDNEVLSELVFGKNISVVTPNAIADCPNLKGIYITSLNPDSYHPAKDIFDGMPNCCFYVPESVYYSDYITDYFWSPFYNLNKLKAY